MRVLLTVTSFLFLVLFVSAQKTADTYAQAKSKKSANLIFMHDGLAGVTGDEKGVLIDVMAKFSQYLKEKDGIDVSSQIILQRDFGKLMADVKASKGGVFALSNISVTEARKRDYTFGPAYLNNISVLITNNNAAQNLSTLSNIKTDFKEMTGYAVANSTYVTRLEEIKSKHFPDLKIVTKPSTVEILDDLATNNKAFTVVDLIYYLGDTKNQKRFKRHAAGDNTTDQLAIAMPKNSDWAPVFSDFFTKFMKTAEYQNIVVKHLGKASLRMIPR